MMYHIYCIKFEESYCKFWTYFAEGRDKGFSTLNCEGAEGYCPTTYLTGSFIPYHYSYTITCIMSTISVKKYTLNFCRGNPRLEKG